MAAASPALPRCLESGQTPIERHNFARIRLTPSRLPYFASMAHRNRALVRYIRVCFELEKYDCPCGVYMEAQSDG